MDHIHEAGHFTTLDGPDPIHGRQLNIPAVEIDTVTHSPCNAQLRSPLI